MRRSLLEVLADPVTGSPLALAEDGGAGGPGGEIESGALRSPEGNTYPVAGGVPRFVLTEDEGQRQTEKSFGFKWGQRDAWYSPEVMEVSRPWFVARYGFGSAGEMEDYFASRGRVLDAGCGGGHASSLWMTRGWRRGGAAEWYGLDISEAVDVARERLGDIPGTHFVQGDILQPPFRKGSFGAILSEGVMHHTPSTERAVKSLAELLAPGGEFLFYVYRKKSPIREFADDYVRDRIAGMSPAEAWEALRPLTRLGQALAELKAEVEVAEDVPLLGIKAGRYDVQRLIYWHVAKLYWRDTLTFEENNHVNFDWYHPRYAWRHTEEEVRRWCAEAGLTVTHFDDTQESGFTVRATRA
jgi:arsenite methyltransferase